VLRFLYFFSNLKWGEGGGNYEIVGMGLELVGTGSYVVSSGCLSSLQRTYSWSHNVLISSPLLPAANGSGAFKCFPEGAVV
jgi:hypothetical protein